MQLAHPVVNCNVDHSFKNDVILQDWCTSGKSSLWQASIIKQCNNLLQTAFSRSCQSFTWKTSDLNECT